MSARASVREPVWRSAALPATMHAAVFLGAGRTALRDVPVPVPGAGEVLVRLEGCGVCASNLPVWEGKPWFGYPLDPGAPGHEGWGRVAAVGAQVRGWSPGERVALLSGHAYAAYDVAPASALVRLPAALDGQDVPAEPLACAVNILRRSGVQPGQPVAIVGIGFIGALLVQLAHAAGARVYALSRRAHALDVARRSGAAEAAAIDGAASERAARAFAGADGFPVVIEAAGEQASLDLAGALVGTGGRLVIAGYHQDGPRHVDMQSWNWRGIDVVNAHERDSAVVARGMQQAVEALVQGGIRLAPLLTHRFALDRLSDAFRTMVSRPDGFLKAVVVP